MADLKYVYQAETRDLTELHILELDEKWGKNFPVGKMTSS
jgi:hypothetical protein